MIIQLGSTLVPALKGVATIQAAISIRLLEVAQHSTLHNQQMVDVIANPIRAAFVMKVPPLRNGYQHNLERSKLLVFKRKKNSFNEKSRLSTTFGNPPCQTCAQRNKQHQLAHFDP